jgi:hypothetical protein
MLPKPVAAIAARVRAMVAFSPSGARPSASRANTHPEDEREGRMPAPDVPLTGDILLAAITDTMVAFHERYHHRRPVTAKTLMLGDDLLACGLAGVCTDVEKTMIEIQRGTVVQETRNAFQNAARSVHHSGREPFRPHGGGVHLRPPHRPRH